MTGLLLAERIRDAADVLVIGAGGGLELKAFADSQPGWSFCGVDPSAEMLGLARRTLGPLASRVDFHEGYIDSAPVGPFDAATCLLTLHFIPEHERRRTLASLDEFLHERAPHCWMAARAAGNRPHPGHVGKPPIPPGSICCEWRYTEGIRIFPVAGTSQGLGG